MKLIESLKNLGLNEKEAKVYLALLQVGKSTAYTVALRSGLKKPTTYVILDQLVEKGFAFKIPRAKKQMYKAESPDVCLALVKERLMFTKDAMPELMAMSKGNQGEKVNVAYFQGVKGAEEMYNNMFKVMKEKLVPERKFIGFYAKEDRSSDELKLFFAQANEKCQQMGISRRAVTVHHPSIIDKYLDETVLDKYQMQAKAIAEDKYSSDISIEVYDQYVQLLSHRNLQGILIQDSDIAKAIKQIFEMVWELVDKDREHYLKFSSLDKKIQKPKESHDINITINKIKEI